MPRVVHFEIPADDPQRAVNFYQKALGWKIERYGSEDYWLVDTGEGPGINGGITPRSNMRAVTNTVEVPSADEFSRKVVEAGGKVIVPKMAIPGVGYLVYCVDSEGNQFGLMQSDPSAK